MTLEELIKENGIQNNKYSYIFLYDKEDIQFKELLANSVEIKKWLRDEAELVKRDGRLWFIKLPNYLESKGSCLKGEF